MYPVYNHDLVGIKKSKYNIMCTTYIDNSNLNLILHI